MLIYCGVAILFLAVIVGLVRKDRDADPDEAFADRNYTPSLGNGRWMDLSERIFDPSDVRWLEDQLAFPKLAKALVAARRRLAIRWLKALQASFDEVVRVQEAASSECPEAVSTSDWRMLWMTYRFKLLVWYALFVVSVFGPYHRLIPSFSWVPIPLGEERSFRHPAMAEGKSSR